MDAKLTMQDCADLLEAKRLLDRVRDKFKATNGNIWVDKDEAEIVARIFGTEWSHEDGEFSDAYSDIMLIDRMFLMHWGH